MTATATEALLPFEDAPLITNPGGLLEQAVAVEEAIDTAAANQLMNNVPQALQQLAQPTKSIWPFDQLSELWKAISPHLSPLSNIVSMLNNHVSMTNSGVSMASTLHSMLKGFAPAAAQAVETAAQNGVQAMSSLGSQLGSSLGSSGLGAGVAANLGRAASVGSLSVPPAWAAANQAVTPAARALPLTSLTSAAQTAPGHMLGGLPLGQRIWFRVGRCDGAGVVGVAAGGAFGAAKCWSGAGFVAGGRGGVERVKRRVRRCGARVERGGGRGGGRGVAGSQC